MDVVGLVDSIFSGGTVGLSLKLALAVIVIGSLVFWSWWQKKQALDAADQATKKGQADEQTSVDPKNSEIFDDAAKAEQSIEDKIKNKH